MLPSVTNLALSIHVVNDDFSFHSVSFAQLHALLFCQFDEVLAILFLLVVKANYSGIHIDSKGNDDV